MPIGNSVSLKETLSDGPTQESSQSRAPLSAAQKSLFLVEALAEAGKSLGVSDIARRVGSTRGTVHKQLAGLMSSGWVEQDLDGRYTLTLKLARLGNAALEQAGLGQRIHAVLQHIAAQANETVSIAALGGDAAIIIQRAESSHVLHADIRVGTRINLDGGASGLVLSAFALDEAARDELRGRGIAVASENVVSEIRQAGVAHTVAQVAEGISAVSIPLYDSLRFKTVALTISGPTQRLDAPAAEKALRHGRDLIVHAMSGLITGGAASHD